DVDCSWEVDVQDAMKVVNHWRAGVGTPEYELYLDLNEDGVINVVDITKVAAELGESYP
ncbi:MAG: dockerin type I domain-containing protein, partial [Candidatus Binatia bacterium]